MKKSEILVRIVSNVPRMFWVETFRRLANVVSEAHAVKDDTRFDRQELPQIEGQIRYAMAFKQLRLAADAAGLHWDDQTTASGGFQYPIVSAPPFMLTVSNIPAVGDLPNAADYRTSLAEAFNAAFTRPKLRDRPVEAARPMYGILIYTVTKATGTAGYLGVGFPTDDYSEWISVFSMAELMEAYDRRSTEQPKKQDDNVNPRIRREKKEGNEE